MQTNTARIVLTVLMGIVLMTVGAEARQPGVVKPQITHGDGPVRVPASATVDQVIHNQGNVATTVDNFGYVGGYSHFGYPSGEFPRNSGHNYLAEIRYWMGAETIGGDTLVANTADDFQAVLDLSLGDEPYDILLSTDTMRFYSYDPDDTVGLGDGNPAQGWRVWNTDSAAWIYEPNFRPSDSQYFPGGPLALQESHYRFNDAAINNTSLMGLDMTHTVMQWNYCYNEDILFVTLDVTNASATDYPNFAFGLYVDLDIGGPDGTGENGRLEDLVATDSAQNLAWIYDTDHWDRGWGSKTGIMGTKMLETPDDVGITGFFTDDWAYLPEDDPGRYEVMTTNGYSPLLAPTDQFYVQCVSGINLTAGKTVRIVYALIAGEDEDDFLANAETAQMLYDNNFVGPQPPITPVLQVRSGDSKAYIYWSDTSETSVDPLSGEMDFSGYKLYRSNNQGKTWGDPIYNTGNSCLLLDYEPIATYNVLSPSDPIPHSFIDTGLYNGVEYWYCLVAMDKPDTATGLDALQSGFSTAGQAPNVVAARPCPDPAGHYSAETSLEHLYTGDDVPSEGSVTPIVFDKAALTGATYRVVFQDDPYGPLWHMLNVNTGDTVLADQFEANQPENLVEVVEGLRIVVKSGDRLPRSAVQTAFAGSDTTMNMTDFYGPAIPNFTGDTTNVWGDVHFRSTYELRVTGDTTLAPSAIEYWSGGPIFEVPFEVWNTTSNERVSAAVYDYDLDGLWSGNDLLVIVNYPYDPVGDLTADAFPYYYWMDVRVRPRYLRSGA